MSRGPSDLDSSFNGSAQQDKAPSLTGRPQMTAELITKTRTQLECWGKAKRKLSTLKAAQSRQGSGDFDSTTFNKEIEQLEAVTKADRELQETFADMQSQGYTLPDLTRNLGRLEPLSLQQIRLAWRAAERKGED